MKKILLLTIAGCLVTFAAVQAQVIADFEIEAQGTQGFADNGWTNGIDGVTRIADPTGRSGGVLAVDFNATKDWRGTFAKTNFSPANAHVISFMVYLPGTFPDSGIVQLMAQDNSNWFHNTRDYYAVDLGKEKWIVVNFDLYSRSLVDTLKFNPYDPNQFGFFGVQLQAGPSDTVYDATFTGQILFDELTLLGDEPKAISDFEVEALGLDGWYSPDWGPGLVEDGLQRVADPTGESEAVLSVSMDAALGTRATLEKDNVSITAEDHVIGIKIWLPTGFPDGAYVQIVGQDNIYWAWNPQLYWGVDLVKDQWNEIYYDVLSRYTIDNSNFDPYTNGIWGKLLIDIDNNTTWTGSLYIDDIVYHGPAPPPTAELLSPPMTATAGVSTVTDPFTDAILYHNVIEWTDLSADIGETYNLYYSESGKITDVTAPGVIQISEQIPRNVEVFNHRMYTVNGEEKTVYYAMTVTGVDEGQVVEKPVRDGISNSDAVTAKTSLLYEIPLVESFDFAADAYLDEFEDLAETFTRCMLRTERPAGTHGDEWDVNSTDSNFKGYIVMDAENIYVGMEVVDDDPTGAGQTWEGDGFDVFGGLYDVAAQTSLFKGTDATGAGQGGYRMGPPINQTDLLQIGGTPFAPDGLVYAQEILPNEGYIVEFKIPFTAMNAQFGPAGSQFTPVSGMLLPLKIDINDNDPAVEDPGRSMQLHWGGPSNFSDWMRAEAWFAPVILTDTPLPPITSVESPEVPVARTFSLSQNYPNPFNPGTTLNYQLPHTSDVTIVVYDLLGKEIRTLVNEKKPAGSYTAKWDGANDAGHQVASGIYFCKMITSDFTKIQKMTLLK